MTGVTVPFDATQLSTTGADDIESQMNFDDLSGCDPDLTTFTGTSTNVWGHIIPERCLPSLAWDPDDWNITEINPLWTTCVPIGGVVFDPPRVLTPVDALSPRTTASSPQETIPPSPGSGVDPVPSITASTTKAADPTTIAIVSSSKPDLSDPPVDLGPLWIPQVGPKTDDRDSSTRRAVDPNIGPSSKTTRVAPTMNLGIPWQPLPQPGPAPGKPTNSANLPQDVSKSNARTTVNPVPTQDSNQGGLGGAQSFDQGGDSERSRNPGQDNNPTRIIIASQNDGPTAQPEGNSQGARNSPLVANPTVAQAAFPDIGAKPTLKTAPTQKPGSSVDGPGNPRLEGNIPQINQPNQPNGPNVNDNPNENNQPGINLPNPTRGSDPGQALSIQPNGDPSQQQASTQESGAGQAQNVEQAGTSNQGQGETSADDIGQPATSDGVSGVGGIADSAENSEMASSSSTPNPQAPAGNQPNNNGPETGQLTPQGPDPQAVVVDGSTLTNNGAPITISGKPVAFSSGVIRVGDEQEHIPAFPHAQDPGFNSFNAAGLTFNPVPSLEPGVTRPMLEVQGQTLTDSGPVIQIGGQDIRLASGAVHIATSIVSVPPPQTHAPSPVVVGGFTFLTLPNTATASRISPLIVAGQTARLENDGLHIGSQTLKPGASPIEVGGIPVSLGSSLLVVGSSTRSFPATTAKTMDTIVGTVGGVPIQAVDAGVMLGSNTLTPGLATTISGTPVSLGSINNLVIGGNTIDVPRSTPIANPNIATVAGLPVRVVESGVRIGSSSLAPGAVATISGTPVSLGASNDLVIGSSTVRITSLISETTNLPIITIASQPIVALPSGSGVHVGSSVLAPGSAVTVSGTPISLGSSDNLVIGGSTLTFSAPAAIPTALSTLIANVGSQSIFALPSGSGVRIGSSTLLVGNAVTVSGTPMSLGSSNHLVIGSSTLTFSLPTATPAFLPSPIATVASQPIFALPSNLGIRVGTTTQMPGAAFTISGTPITVGSSNLVIGSSTLTFPPSDPTPYHLTIGSQVITENSASQFVIGSQTLAASSPLTISGITYSLDPSETAVIINGVTSPLQQVPTDTVITLDGQTITQSSVIGSSTHPFPLHSLRSPTSPSLHHPPNSPTTKLSTTSLSNSIPSASKSTQLTSQPLIYASSSFRLTSSGATESFSGSTSSVTDAAVSDAGGRINRLRWWLGLLGLLLAGVVGMG
ncbi:hypothetical protein G7Y79_00067g095370 [Physcia stellaris]|nr:hypothetical protein G7Y79_00067g095370 [Physcia stellaris]